MRASGVSVGVKHRLHVVGHTQQLHMNEIGLDKQFKHEKIQASDLVTDPALSLQRSPLPVPCFDGETFLGGPISKIPVLNVSTNRQEVHRFRQTIWQHRRCVDPAGIVTFRSIDFCITIVTIVPNKLFQG